MPIGFGIWSVKAKLRSIGWSGGGKISTSFAKDDSRCLTASIRRFLRNQTGCSPVARMLRAWPDPESCLSLAPATVGARRPTFSSCPDLKEFSGCALRSSLRCRCFASASLRGGRFLCALSDHTLRVAPGARSTSLAMSGLLPSVGLAIGGLRVARPATPSRALVGALTDPAFPEFPSLNVRLPWFSATPPPV